MSQYVNLDRAAEVLGLSTGDVNRLREQGKIQGFRDGANWKFRQEDVERYLTQMIKEKSQGAMPSDVPGEDDDDSLFTLDDGTGEGEDTLGSLFDDVDETPAAPAVAAAPASAAPASAAPSSAGPVDKGDDLDFSGGFSSSSMMQDDDDLLLDLSGDDGLSLLDEPAGTSSDPDDIILGGPQPSKSTSDSSNVPSSPTVAAPAAAPADDDMLLVAEDDDAGYQLADSEPAPAATPVSAPKATQDDDDLLLALADDDAPTLDTSEPAKSTSDDQLNIAEEEEDDGGIFGLAGEPEAVAPTMPSAAPAAVSSNEDDFDSLISEPESESKTEDFQLSPGAGAQDESDSESASQTIALDDNPFGEDSTTDFGSLSSFDNSASDLPPSMDFPGDQSSSDFGSLPNSGPFDGEAPSFGGGAPFDAGGAPFDASGAPSFDPVGNGGDFSDDGGYTAPGPEIHTIQTTTTGCSYKAGKGCEREAHYSGADIFLLILPILLIIPAAMGAYELIRTIWGWDQQFELFGPILQKIGELVKLTK